MTPLLSIQSLQVAFHSRNGVAKAVEDISIDIAPGEIVGVAGESGSGKSVTFQSIFGLIPSPPAHISGKALFDGEDLLAMPQGKLRQTRAAKLGMVFQEPMTSLNPYMSVKAQLVEPLQLRGGFRRSEMEELAVESLRTVGVPEPERRIRQYPHEFSGGMRQRVMIAMALIASPKLLVADEPTSALDVTVQSQIIELLEALAREKRMSVALVTHDLGIAATVCDRVCILYGGRVMEDGPAEAVLSKPAHPYTQGLLASIPRVDTPKGRIPSIPGDPVNPFQHPPGCPFAPRCPWVEPACSSEEGTKRYEAGQRRSTSCRRWREILT